MGCPAKNIAKIGAGAGLIRTPDRALEILRRTRQGILDWVSGQRIDEIGLPSDVVESVPTAQRRDGSAMRSILSERLPGGRFPVSVKTRLGYDHHRHQRLDPVASFGISCRDCAPRPNAAQYYRGEADWKRSRARPRLSGESAYDHPWQRRYTIRRDRGPSDP